MWVEHEIHTLLQKLDWWQEEKNTKNENRQLFFTPHDPFNSYASEMEAIAEIKKPKTVYNQIHVSPMKNTGFSSQNTV